VRAKQSYEQSGLHWRVTLVVAVGAQPRLYQSDVLGEMPRNIGETPEIGLVLTVADAFGEMESGNSREPKNLASFLKAVKSAISG
jgi:hypothetical protein